MQTNDWQQNITPNVHLALALAKREISVLVHDAVVLEGINYTLPEVQTLLEGITVGGHKLSDQQITLNQGEAWNFLFHHIQHNTFEVTPEFVYELHAIAAKEEALEWGCFRTGSVTIAGSDYMPPKASLLYQLFQNLQNALDEFNDAYDRAIYLFLIMSRYKFFLSANKRMGRFMMNGVLLSAGYPAINLPARRKLEFNTLMLAFYESGDERDMNTFMRSCVDERFVMIMNEQV